MRGATVGEARRKPRLELQVIPGGVTGRGFDPLIHERIRLAVLSALAVNDKLTFKALKSLLEVSDGNLSVHCRRLEEARYLKVYKSFKGRTPCTEFRLAAAGRRALDHYLDHMEALIQQVRDGK